MPKVGYSKHIHATLSYYMDVCHEVVGRREYQNEVIMHMILNIGF